MKTTTTLALFFLLAAAWVASPAVAETAYPVEWIRQIGTDSDDRSYSVAVDDSGNAYIGGFTQGSLVGANAGSLDAILSKFDSTGNEIWTRQIGTSGWEFGFSVAVDGAGNAYLSGATEGNLGGVNAGQRDAFLMKFDPNGTELWTQQTGTGGNDYGHSVVVDGAGNAYISGFTESNVSVSKRDAFLTKFDSNGSELWAQQIGTVANDESLSVAVDGLGNAYISGYTRGNLEGTNAGSRDAFLTKFNSTGTKIWTQQIGTNDWDTSYSVAVDEVGNAYLSGATGGGLEGANAGGRDAFITKFDSSGSELWTRQIGTDGGDYSRSVAVGGAGEVYISGFTEGNLGGASAGGTDAFFTKFDSDGTEIWAQQIGTDADDWSMAVSVDGEGNIFISGHTRGSLGGTNAGSLDAFLIKFTGPVPEPTTGLLAALATTGLLLRRRQQKVGIDWMASRRR